jgi:hypothetical protein
MKELVVTVVAALALALSATVAGQIGDPGGGGGTGGFVSVQPYDENGDTVPDSYQVVNSEGTFYIATSCLRETISPQPEKGKAGWEPREGQPGWDPHNRQADGVNEIGPGYIFAAVARKPPPGGASLDDPGATDSTEDYKTHDMDDVSMSDTRSGTWGKFGAHVARYKGYPFGGGSSNGQEAFGTRLTAAMKEVQGGLCLDDTKTNDPDYGAGVSSSSSVGPTALADGSYALSVTVRLSDGLADIFQVRYDYIFTGSTIRLWTTVKNLCPDGGGCDGSGAVGNPVYIKEPKFSVGDYGNKEPYAGLEVLNVYPYIRSDDRCPAWHLTDPHVQTVACTDQYRQRLWLGYAAPGFDPGNGCESVCTEVLAEGVDSSGNLLPWASSTGLDRWRQIAFAGNPLPNRDPAASCGAPKPPDWELGRWDHRSADNYSPEIFTAVQAGFLGWPGGTGLMDCQDHFLNPGPSASYGNYFEFDLVYPPTSPGPPPM